MRIALTIHSLEGGGAQRVAVVLAEGFARQGDTVMILTSQGKDTDFYRLPADIVRRAIGPSGKGGIVSRIVANVRYLRRLRTSLLDFRPDVVISFMATMNTRVLLALAGSTVPVIVREGVDSRLEELPLVWRLARRLLYYRAAKMVSTSQGVDRGFGWLPPSRRTVLYNPLSTGLVDETETPDTSFHQERRHLVSMGRLTHQKGHDLLITAFADVARDHPSWDLMILGEGEEREALERLVRQLGLDGRVRLPGALPHPFPTLKRCEIFVLASRWEGFGNVLTEAMACGLPVIAADCPSGPGEIIEDGINGLLVPVEDTRALERAMRRLIEAPSLRRLLTERGRTSASRYRSEIILEQWRRLLAEVCGAGPLKKRRSPIFPSGKKARES